MSSVEFGVRSARVRSQSAKCEVRSSECEVRSGSASENEQLAVGGGQWGSDQGE